MTPVYQKWDDFFTGLETGDIILMHGLFDSSIFIETITGSNWSHSAVIVISDDLGIKTVPTGTVLLWESNIQDGTKGNPKNLTVTDVILNQQKDGPIIDPLKERITNNHELGYDSDVAKRKLNFTRTPAMFTTFNNLINAVHKDNFPAIPWGEMTHFAEGRIANVPVKDNTFFCSQLVAYTYKALGLLDNKHVDNWYAPANFAEGNWDVALLKGATLGPEIRLDLSTIPPYPGK